MENLTVVVFGEDSAFYQQLAQPILESGWKLDRIESESMFKRAQRQLTPDLVIVRHCAYTTWDFKSVANQIRQLDRLVPLILVIDCSSESVAIEALRTGFNDYFTYPLVVKDIIASVRRHLAERHRLSTTQPLGRAGTGETLVGDSSPMCNIKTCIAKIAPTDATVLITGATGTGKECLARAMHQHSRRRHKPMVCINCAALPEGLLESELFGFEKGAFTGAQSAYHGKLKSAEGGTVLFDEIAEMNPYAQSKLLRVIENREFSRLGGTSTMPLDVRVIAATNQDIEHLMQTGKFRADLFYRLDVCRIHIPALREHKEDIPLLLQHFSTYFADRYGKAVDGIAADALQTLFKYDWPGNVRELRNVLEFSLINMRSGQITLQDLPEKMWKLCDLVDDHGTEKEELLTALVTTKWNKSEAARKLHWSRMTLYRKMAKYHIEHTPTHDEFSKPLSGKPTPHP